MSSSQEKSLLSDSQCIASIIKDLGIHKFDKRALDILLKYNNRQSTQILEQAKSCSKFANKDIIDADDIQMAIRLTEDGASPKSPSCDVQVKTSNESNIKQFPAMNPVSGLIKPKDESSLLQTNHKLKTDLNFEQIVWDDFVKITATEMINAAKQTEDVYITDTDTDTNTDTKSDQMLDDLPVLTDIDTEEVIGNQAERSSHRNRQSQSVRCRFPIK